MDLRWISAQANEVPRVARANLLQSAAVAQAPNLREERTARVIDREVAPLWHDRFARAMWRHLPGEQPALVLDVACGGGRTTAELMQRVHADTKVIGLEADPLLRELAKARLGEWKDRVYLKAGSLDDVASMTAGSYDLVLANLVLGEVTSLPEALRELVRVTKPGGQLLATLPLDGSWAEAEDLYREVLRDAGARDAGRRLRRLAQLRPTGHELARALTEIGVSPHHFVIEQERFELLFAGGREFLFAPVVELGPLRMWKAIIGDGGKPQELFWRLKESIDTYFAGHVFAVTVVAGLVRVRVPERGAAAHAAAETAGEHWRQWPQLDALWQAIERRDQAATDIDLDIDLDAEPEPAAPAVVAATTSRPETPAASMSASMPLTDEDEAIFALLEQPVPSRAGNDELDALLDQVLEFAAPREDVTELDEDELEEAEPDAPAVDRPGDTLQRIRALLPPPPTLSTPPPPPGRRQR